MPRKKQPEAPPTPPRTLADIQREYQETCGMLGEREYRKRIVEAEMQDLSRRLLALNEEAAKLPKES